MHVIIPESKKPIILIVVNILSRENRVKNTVITSPLKITDINIIVTLPPGESRSIGRDPTFITI